MQLHTLQPIHSRRRPRPRVGRGGKRGTTAGRGQKGQRAHAGRRIPSGLKEILGRLPKLRGAQNKPITAKPKIFNLDQLAKIAQSLPEKQIITKELLLEKGLLRRKDKTVKILGNGELKKAVILKNISVSRSAREKIEAVGGLIK